MRRYNARAWGDVPVETSAGVGGAGRARRDQRRNGSWVPCFAPSALRPDPGWARPARRHQRVSGGGRDGLADGAQPKWPTICTVSEPLRSRFQEWPTMCTDRAAAEGSIGAFHGRSWIQRRTNPLERCKRWAHSAEPRASPSTSASWVRASPTPSSWVRAERGSRAHPPSSRVHAERGRCAHPPSSWVRAERGRRGAPGPGSMLWRLWVSWSRLSSTQGSRLSSNSAYPVVLGDGNGRQRGGGGRRSSPSRPARGWILGSVLRTFRAPRGPRMTEREGARGPRMTARGGSRGPGMTSRGGSRGPRMMAGVGRVPAARLRD